jgi:acetyl esterase/lipase
MTININNLVEVSYDSHASQYYTYQLPDTITNDTSILFYFHGGGWKIGNSNMIEKYINNIVDNNTIFVSVEYRQTGEPTLTHPYNSSDIKQQDIIDDAIDAINHATTLASSVSISTDNITLSGSSAGAWIVANIISHSSEINEYSSINQAILFSGDYNADPYFEITEGDYEWVNDPTLFNWYNNWVGGIDGAINAIDNVTSISEDIDIDIFHGGMDTLTIPSQANDFVDALNLNGNNVNYTVFSESGHSLHELYINEESKDAFEALVTVVGRDTDLITQYFDEAIILDRDYKTASKDIFDWVEESSWTDSYYEDSSQKTFVENVWYNFSGYEGSTEIIDYYVNLLNTNTATRASLLRLASETVEIDNYIVDNSALIIGIYESNIDLF